MDTLALQAFVEAIAAHQASALSQASKHPEGVSNLELQADLEQVTAQIQQLVQKYPSLQKSYEAAFQRLRKLNAE